MQNDRTPLTEASYNGHLKTVEVLLAHKADVIAKNKVSRRRGGACAPMGGLGGQGLGVEVWVQGSVMD